MYMYMQKGVQHKMNLFICSLSSRQSDRPSALAQPLVNGFGNPADADQIRMLMQ